MYINWTDNFGIDILLSFIKIFEAKLEFNLISGWSAFVFGLFLSPNIFEQYLPFSIAMHFCLSIELSQLQVFIWFDSSFGHKTLFDAHHSIDELDIELLMLFGLFEPQMSVNVIEPHIIRMTYKILILLQIYLFRFVFHLK